MTNFTDAFKNKFLEGFMASDLTTTGILVSLAVAAALGFYIYFVYRFTVKSSFYSRSFNKTLALLPIVTAGILLAMQSNIVISLGMVGALSIVRFRNAVKDPMDLLYLFWSISVGIITGAGMFELAAISSFAVTALVFLLDLMPTFKAPCVLVVSAKDEAAVNTALECVKKHAKRAKVRSKNITNRSVEVIVELSVDTKCSLPSEIAAVEGVTSVNLLSHDGDVRF